MDIDQLLSELRTERDRVDQAIAALEALDNAPVPGMGRPKGGTSFEFGASKPTGRGPRRMSAAALRRIAEAMKKRWAARKASATAPRGKAAPKARGGKRRISAAGLKRISEAAKRRWAKVKVAKTPARRGMSAVARKRLSLLAKQRWAKRKQAQKA
jgi:hypothetical protein